MEIIRKTSTVAPAAGDSSPIKRAFVVKLVVLGLIVLSVLVVLGFAARPADTIWKETAQPVSSGEFELAHHSGERREEVTRGFGPVEVSTEDFDLQTAVDEQYLMQRSLYFRELESALYENVPQEFTSHSVEAAAILDPGMSTAQYEQLLLVLAELADTQKSGKIDVAQSETIRP